MSKASRDKQSRGAGRIVTTITSAPIVSEPRVRRPRRAKERKRLTRRTGPNDWYQETLRRPFDIFPRPLGFGTMVPTSVQTAWNRMACPVGGEDTWCVIIFRMGLYNNIQIQRGIADTQSSPMFPYQGYLGSMSNINQIANSAQAGRVISAGLRVRVRCSSTSPSGTVYAGFCNADSISNLLNMSANSLSALPFVDRIDSAAGDSGEIRAEVDYRPRDTSSFNFEAGWVNSTYTPPTTTIQPLLFVLATGYVPGSWVMDFDCIEHLETMGGLDPSIDDTKGGAEKGISMDDVFRYAKAAGVNVGSFVTNAVGAYNTLRSAYLMMNSARTLMAPNPEVERETDADPPGSPVDPGPGPNVRPAVASPSPSPVPPRVRR